MFDALDELASNFVKKGLGAEDWRRFVGTDASRFHEKKEL